MEKLPVYSLNKKKGNLAADYLKRVISNFAVVNIIDESVDLGIDMRAELLKETSPIGLLIFRVKEKMRLIAKQKNKGILQCRLKYQR